MFSGKILIADDSQAVARVFDTVRSVAASTTNVLVTGESATAAIPSVPDRAGEERAFPAMVPVALHPLNLIFSKFP